MPTESPYQPIEFRVPKSSFQGPLLSYFHVKYRQDRFARYVDDNFLFTKEVEYYITCCKVIEVTTVKVNASFFRVLTKVVELM